ncbi:MAG: TrkH family potassium uptake protein [Egibacteraceae bacterium]
MGIALHLPAVMAGLTVIVALLAGETAAAWAFAGSGAACLGVAQLAVRLLPSNEERSSWLGMMSVAISWIIVAASAALPLWGTAVLMGDDAGAARVFTDPGSALFEGFSGFTGTGLTMVGRESQLPAAVQWWRTLTEWVGGLGIVVFAVAVLRPVQGSRELYLAEARDETIHHSMRGTVLRMWGLYLGLTTVSVLALAATGTGWWVALNHGMTGIATGGFAVTDESFVATSALTRSVAIVIMAAGAISFVTHHLLLVERDYRAALRRTELRAFVFTLVAGALVMEVVNSIEKESPSLLDSAFQWVSAAATAGFNSVDLRGWGSASLLQLVTVMIVGACAGSTGGGVKVDRAIWVFKDVRQRYGRLWAEGRKEPGYRFNGENVDRDDAEHRVSIAAALVSLWAATLFIGTVVLLLTQGPDANLDRTLFDAASALGTVGLTSGLTSPDLPGLSKAVLVVLMWMGRLEIFAALLLFQAPFVPLMRRFGRDPRDPELNQAPEEAIEPAGEEA